MSQLTFAEAEFENKKHTTRREIFLQRMDKLIPWARLEKKIAKHDPKGERRRLRMPATSTMRTSFYMVKKIGCGPMLVTPASRNGKSTRSAM